MPKQRDSKLIEAVFAAPWCMEREYFDKMTDLVIRHVEGDLLSESEVDSLVAARIDNLTVLMADERQSDADKAERARPWTLHGGVARIPVGGIIARHSGMVNRTSGPSGVGHDTIRRQFAEAMADTRVRSILFHIDSPGGSAQGMEALSEEIYEARGTKPIYAYSSGMMASAALYLGAQADKVYADTDALVGSIGTLIIMRDVSRAFEDKGIKTHVIASGPNKGTGTPGAAITPEQLRPYQSIVDSLADAFVRDMARGRGVSAEEIQRHATGEIWMATKAQEHGLIDGTRRSINALITELNERHPAQSSSATPTASVQPAMPVDAGTAEAVASGGASMPTSNGNWAVTAPPKIEPATAGITNNQPEVDLQAIRAQAAREAAARISEIQNRAKPFMDREGVREIVDAAVQDPEASPQAFADQLLAHLTEAEAPKSHIPSVQPGADARDKRIEAVSLRMANRITDLETKLNGDRAQQVARAIGYDSPDQARRAIRDASSVGSTRLDDIAFKSIATAQNISYEQARDRFMSHEEGFMAAAFHSTSDFPALLSNLAKKSLLAQFNEVQPFWRNIAQRTTTTDFKESTTVRLSGSGDLRLILEGGSPEHTTLNERSEKIKVEKYGRAITLTFEMIRNDDLSGFGNLTQVIGRSGARLPDQLIIMLLAQNAGDGPTMSDGKGAFFAAGRGNLAPTPAALSYAEVRKARRAMMALQGFGPDPEYIEVEPRVLLVPTGLSDTAADIVMQEFVPGSEGGNNQRNTLRGRMRDVHSPRLSGDGWYLFADPADLAAFQVQFLDGQEQPTVSLIESKTTPFAREFWAYLPGVGVAPVNPEAGYRNAGAGQ